MYINKTRQQRTVLTALSMSECYAAPKQMEKTTKSITKLPYFVRAGMPNHNLHHPITPSNETLFENRWNLSTKSMSIDFYDKQPLCVINCRIKKYPALISCSPSVLSFEHWSGSLCSTRRLTNWAG